MTFDELIDAVLDILPDAGFETDNDGQIIIYTDLIDTGETLKSFSDLPA